MTDHEKAIVEAYTGFVMLTSDKIGIFYKYVEEKLGHPVMTHELAMKEIQEAIQKAAKDDFIELCSDEANAVKPILDFDGKDVWRCGNCGGTIFHPSNTQADEDEKNYNKYCRKCGREVKWNDESGSDWSN